MSDVDGTLAETHVVPVLGNKKLADLRAHDIDRLLAAKRDSLSTATLARVLAVLRRSIRWAEARDLVGRNVAALCSAPTGTDGRPSKSLTLDQARNVMLAAESSPLAAYVVLALLTGLRTEELRALTWDHLDLAGDAQSVPPRPPSVQVWRSVRAGGAPRRGARGEPSRCRTGASRRSTDSGTRSSGRACGLRRDSSSPPTTGRSSMRRTCGAPFDTSDDGAGLDSAAWTPRELRHSFVSLLSDAGVPVEEIAPRRPLEHDRHGNGLPQAAPSGADRGSAGHGHALRPAGPGRC
jgi:integrase